MQLFTVIHLRDGFPSPFTQKEIIVLREGVKTVGVYDTSVRHICTAWQLLRLHI